MNRPLTTLLTALPFAVALAAQDAAGDTMPNPKTKAHELLTTFVGTWRVETSMAAMPGIPGMEKPTQWTGIERAELICNGLWLKVSGESTCNGQISHSIWLLGYDPYAKVYQCLGGSNMDDASCCIEATYDAATKTWDFHGQTSGGPFRSVFVQEADRSVETCYSQGEDGKDAEFMRAVRTRVKDAVPKDATSKPAGAAAVPEPELPAPLAALHKNAGAWDADFKMEMPGAPPMTAKCREVVAPICGGKWTWSTFTGNVMGAPFEGHALTGCDGKSGQVTSYWLDSTNGAFMRTDGTYDAKQQSFTMSGTCYDQQGNRSPVASTTAVTGKDARQSRMVFGEGDTRSVMTIAYRRAAK